MIITILQYVEALTSPDGRFRTLERLHPAGDEAGAPLLSMPGHGLVDFEVMTGGVRHTLRCPLRYDGDTAARLRAIAEKDKDLGGRFFTEWRVAESEIVLFDEDGAAFEVDVLVRLTLEGEPLADFLARASMRGDNAAVGVVSESFGELVRWAETVGTGGIAMRNLLVAPDGALSVKAFSATDETRRILEMLSSGIGGADPRGQGGTEASGYDLDGEGNVRCVRDGGGWMYVDRTGRAVIDAVWTAALPFRGGRAEVETRAGRGLIDIRGREVLSTIYEEVVWDDYWGLATVMTEGRWSLADRDGNMLSEGYDWLGECSEGLVLAVRDGRCGFLDTTGREAIPCIYDDASSFSEGCALVSLGGKSYFIDARGNVLKG